MKTPNKFKDKYLLSFVEEGIFDPKYFSWTGGRMEIHTYEDQFAIDEIRFFTRRNDKWIKFNDEYDGTWVDKSTLNEIIKIIKSKFHATKHRSGFITLISVLVVGAVGVAIALAIILLGLGSSRTSFAIEQSNQAKALANACAEEATQQIRDSTPFTGSGSLTLGQGACTYTVTSQGGQNRTITASGTVSTVIRKVKIIISNISPAITVTSWQEVADF